MTRTRALRIGLMMATVGVFALICGGVRPALAKGAARWTIGVISIEGKGDDALNAKLADEARKAADTRDGFAPPPPGLPDPIDDPDGYSKAVAKKKLKAFTLRIKVVKFVRTLTPVANSKDQTLDYQLDLDLLGVSMPESTFGFTGHGSAQITAPVGPTVSPRLEEHMRQQLVEAALTKAFDEASRQLAKAKTK